MLHINCNNLRNEFEFWNVHGIMNTLGLLQETQSIHDSMIRPKIECLYLHFIINIYNIEIIYNLGDKNSIVFDM